MIVPQMCIIKFESHTSDLHKTIYLKFEALNRWEGAICVALGHGFETMMNGLECGLEYNNATDVFEEIRIVRKWSTRDHISLGRGPWINIKGSICLALGIGLETMINGLDCGLDYDNCHRCVLSAIGFTMFDNERWRWYFINQYSSQLHTYEFPKRINLFQSHCSSHRYSYEDPKRIKVFESVIQRIGAVVPETQTDSMFVKAVYSTYWFTVRRCKENQDKVYLCKINN